LQGLKNLYLGDRGHMTAYGPQLGKHVHVQGIPCIKGRLALRFYNGKILGMGGCKLNTNVYFDYMLAG
jgi:hypothetical protein